MIWLYTGTPGSGKSLHAARDIVVRMRRGGGLICNFPVNADAVPKAKSTPIYIDNSDLTPQYLVDYAFLHHKVGKEGQCLVVIDEAQVLFNCREFGAKGRMEWVKLFSQHRHLGYNFILIAQFDRMIDRQIRSLVEYQVKHRKANNYGFGGMLLSLLTGMSWFVAIESWYGMTGKEAVCGKDFFPYRKRYGRIYDSYRLFDVGAAVPPQPSPGTAPPVCGGGGAAQAAGAPASAGSGPVSAVGA